MDGVTQDAGARAEFTGLPGRFFRLALVGNLLLLPTFGFYRFWLTTDLRRHLWTHTRLGGDSFEYTGRGRELLIGFLIATAILMPLYIGYFILTIEAERWQAFASVPFALVIYVLAHYGSYRARRYRATRTTFRGVRLWMTGSGWSYAGRAILWDALSLLSLGLTLPWRAAALERFKMRHTHFGDLPGSFAGTGWAFFKRGWWLWLLFLLPLGVMILATGTAAYNVWLPPEDDGWPALDRFAAGIGLALVLWLPILMIGFPLFRAIELRWWLEGIRFGDVTMTSALRKRSVLWCYVRASLVSGVVAGVFGIVFATIVESTGFSFEELVQPGTPSLSLMIIVGVAYMALLLAMSILMLQFVTRGIWEAVALSVTVFNVAALDTVAAHGAAAGSLGEGLTDALDFGAGVGV